MSDRGNCPTLIRLHTRPIAVTDKAKIRCSVINCADHRFHVIFFPEIPGSTLTVCDKVTEVSTHRPREWSKIFSTSKFRNFYSPVIEIFIDAST